MTKKEARKELEQYIESKMKFTNKMNLPIKDETILFEDKGKGELISYTFIGLIKIAYGLNG